MSDSGTGGTRREQLAALEHGTETVAEPLKLFRLVGMTRRVLQELHGEPLSGSARRRVRYSFRESVAELESQLSKDLRDELSHLVPPVPDEEVEGPSEPELRVAEAQLSGWLEGLLQAVEASALAQLGADRRPEEGRSAGAGARPYP